MDERIKVGDAGDPKIELQQEASVFHSLADTLLAQHKSKNDELEFRNTLSVPLGGGAPSLAESEKPRLEELQRRGGPLTERDQSFRRTYNKLYSLARSIARAARGEKEKPLRKQNGRLEVNTGLAWEDIENQLALL